MTDFRALIKLLQGAVDNFQQVIPGIQQDMLDRLREQLAGLKLNGRNIAISAENVSKIAAIKAKLQDIVLTPEYKDAVKNYLKTFDKVHKLQNSYFNQLSDKFSPPEIGEALKKQAAKDVLQNLTERGIDANVLSGVEDILRKNITTGGSYADLQKQLENNITDNHTGDGALTRYTKQITTDALNQHSAQYTQLVSSDLGLEWYVYAGSNIETSRPFCLACTKKRYIHISEFPALLDGDFPEFREFNGKLYKGLPAGMIPDTTPANFPVNRGGYNCGHQLRPVSDHAVPEEVKFALTRGAPQETKAAPIETKNEKPAVSLTDKQKQTLSENPSFKAHIAKAERKQDVHPELDIHEKAAAIGYTGHDYYDLNKFLRKELSPKEPEFLEAYVDALNAALDKMTSVYEGPVFRGTRLTQEHIDEYIAAYNSGTPISKPAFTSTSKDAGGAFGGNVLFTIISRNGKAMEGLSQFADEMEVLFRAGTKFKVISVNKGPDRTFITMEEL